MTHHCEVQLLLCNAHSYKLKSFLVSSDVSLRRTERAGTNWSNGQFVGLPPLSFAFKRSVFFDGTLVSLEGNHKAFFIGVIPSFPEHQQVLGQRGKAAGI